MSRMVMPWGRSSWWDDFDRPLSLFDQHFGMPVKPDDIITPLLQSALRPSMYYRPWRQLDRQQSGLSTVQNEKDKFSIMLDVQQFRPDEVTVKTLGNAVTVEGKHEEKQDEHGFVSRHFVRKYALPPDVEPESVVSSLSSDGVLTIAAPKKALPPPDPSERIVPIQQTGSPALTTEEKK